jgi:hypothetical protein
MAGPLGEMFDHGIYFMDCDMCVIDLSLSLRQVAMP